MAIRHLNNGLTKTIKYGEKNRNDLRRAVDIS